MVVPIDFATETALSLNQARKLLPPSRGLAMVHRATLTRWINTGAIAHDGRRVFLRAARCGSRWITSAGAMQEFLAAMTPEPASRLEVASA